MRGLEWSRFGIALLVAASALAVAFGQSSPRAPGSQDRQGAQAQEKLIRQYLDIIRDLHKAGQHQKAAEMAAYLARRFPDHPLVQQMRESTGTAGRLSEQGQLAGEKAAGTTGALNEVQRSAIPSSRDIEYSRDFASLSRKRQERYGMGMVRLTEREKAIVRTLDEVVAQPVDLQNVTFEKALDVLRSLFGDHPLHVDSRAMKELEITYQSKLSVFVGKGVSKRTLLRRVLGELGMTYIVKNEAIEITSLERAKNEMTVRYYPIDDLLPMGFLSFFGGGVGNFAGTGSDGDPSVPAPVQRLIDLITSIVDPGSWDKNGGPGTIIYYAPARVLVVRNSAEVHATLSGGLRR